MINKNINKIKQEIANICKACKRSSEDVILIAVSKYNPIKAIETACENGVNNFGENKAQEFSEKAELLQQNIVWHFIGHLQSNKVKTVVPKADFIHSVDSEKLLNEINKRAAQNNKVQKILLEIKTSSEETKFGIKTEEEAFRLAEISKQLENIELVGLMTMAEFTDNKTIIRNCFKKLKTLQNKMLNAGYNVMHLSMGMTNDFDIAIEEGATMIRIGTAIFGQRDYSKSWKEI